MEKPIEKIKQWIADEPLDWEIPKTPFDTMAESALSRMFHYLAPVLLTALAIDLAVMFAAPVETTKTRWFWLKEPLSIGLAYLVYR